MSQGMNKEQMFAIVQRIVQQKPFQWVVSKSHSHCCDYYFVGPRGGTDNWFYIDQGYGQHEGELGIGNCRWLTINNLVPAGNEYAMCAAAIKIFDRHIQKEENAFRRFIHGKKNYFQYIVDYDTKAGTYTLSLNQQPKFVLTPKKDGLYLNRPSSITTHSADVLVPTSLKSLDTVLERAASLNANVEFRLNGILDSKFVTSVPVRISDVLGRATERPRGA